ncbi:MAG: hypothetical protein ABIV94_09365 [Acidimicrobiales bacterium]
MAPWSAPDARPVEQAVLRATPPHPVVVRTEAPPGAPLVSHPLTRFDIVDTALDTIKAAPRAVLGATALFLVPTEVLSTYVRRDELDLSDLNDAITPSWVVAIVLRLLVLSFVTFAVAHLVWAWQRGEAPTATEAAAAAVRRAPALIVAWVVVHLLEGVAALLLLLPLLVVAPLLFAAVPVIAIERSGALASLGRSWRLGARDLPLLVGGFLIIALVGLALMTGLSGLTYISDAVFDSFDISGAWIVQAAVRLATWMIVVPFLAAACTLTYLDLRVRREGLDIELAVARHFGKR